MSIEFAVKGNEPPDFEVLQDRVRVFLKERASERSVVRQGVPGSGSAELAAGTLSAGPNAEVSFTICVEGQLGDPDEEGLWTTFSVDRLRTGESLFLAALFAALAARELDTTVIDEWNFFGQGRRVEWRWILAELERLALSSPALPSVGDFGDR